MKLRITVDHDDETGRSLVSVGVQPTDKKEEKRDPILRSLPGTIDQALSAIPGIVQAAQSQWASAPQYQNASVPAVAAKAPPKAKGKGKAEPEAAAVKTTAQILAERYSDDAPEQEGEDEIAEPVGALAAAEDGEDG